MSSTNHTQTELKISEFKAPQSLKSMTYASSNDVKSEIIDYPVTDAVYEPADLISETTNISNISQTSYNI